MTAYYGRPPSGDHAGQRRCVGLRILGSPLHPMQPSGGSVRESPGWSANPNPPRFRSPDGMTGAAETPRIAVVVVTYNSTPVLADCLRSLEASAVRPVTVVVAD